MTLEAAMVIPVFLFFMMNVLNLFEAARLQSSLRHALQECGQELCEKAYYTVYTPRETVSSGNGGEGAETDSGMGGDIGLQVFTKAYVQNRINSSLGRDYLRRTCVGGSVSCLKSEILTEDGNVLLIAEYRLKPFIPVLALPSFSMQSCFFGHAWVGYRGGQTGSGEGDISAQGREVYVARYGVVYHEDRNCIYLNPQISSVPASALDTLRSGDGSIYYPCEVCRPDRSGTVLITKEGNRYHCDPDCGGIGRTVSLMEEGDAQMNYRPCPICAAGGEKDHEH